MPVLQPFPYQRDGAAFLAPRLRCGLFDVPGVGKTAQVIVALDMIQAKRIIIVCPAAVRAHWRAELRRFSDTPWRIAMANSVHDVGAWLAGKLDILILSYERASRWSKHLQVDIFDVIVFDESHNLKTSDSGRTIAMLGANCSGEHGLARFASRAWFLTGTPMPNDPIDLWPFLRFTGATSMTKAPFTARYFTVRQKAFGTRQSPRDTYVDELRQVIEAYSMRRSKAQVGLQIPPIFLSTATMDGDTAEVRALLNEHPGLEDAVREAVNTGGLSMLKSMEFPIATLRRLVGEAKALPYAETLVTEFAGGKGKLVIIGVHIKALATIHEHLAKAGVEGLLLTNPDQAGEYVQRFQTDPKCKYFAVNIKRGGTGLTLTAAADLDMFESSWTPGDNDQAIMRVHRVGQEKNVRARFIELHDSIDSYVTTVVKQKTEAILKLDTAA